VNNLFWSFRAMSSTKRTAQKDPPPSQLRRNDSDLSDRSEDSDGEGGPDSSASLLELPPTHDRRHPKHLEDSNVLASHSNKFKQNYPFNRKAIPSLLSSESPFHNYRGFLHLAGLILVRVFVLSLIWPLYHILCTVYYLITWDSPPFNLLRRIHRPFFRFRLVSEPVFFLFFLFPQLYANHMLLLGFYCSLSARGNL
jgi:hypothetical protein